MKSVPHLRAESVIEAALRYITLGWKVFPLHSLRNGACTCGNPECTSPGKHPRTTHRLKDATTDPEQVHAWWEQWPDANIGIAPGAESGLVVVDVDPRHRGTLEALGDLPPTLTVRTGGGGWHLYSSIQAASASGTARVEDLPRGSIFVVREDMSMLHQVCTHPASTTPGLVRVRLQTFLAT